jgi:MscS family membrane protein
MLGALQARSGMKGVPMSTYLDELYLALRHLSDPGHRGLMEGITVLVVTFIAAALSNRIMELLRAPIGRLPDPALAVKILEMLKRPLWLTVLVMGSVAGGSQVFTYFQLSVPTILLIGRVLESAVVVVWFVPATRILMAVCDKWSGTKPQATEAIRFVKHLAIAALFIQCALIFLSVWHVDVTPLLASAGIAGMAIGFAVKDTLANFFGGVTLFLDRPFKVGDQVVLSTGERGEVVEIGLRSTRVLTEDHVLVTVPNAIMASTKIANESAPGPRIRLRITIGVVHGSDIDMVESVLLSIAKDDPLIADEPEPLVRFLAFGDASLQFELQCWIDSPTDRSAATDSLNRAIYKEFAAAGIGIPYTKKEILGKPAQEK